ncbi:MAG: PDZ domain-containing protein [Candidatus Sulfotelmatobacter sp.]
MLLFALACSAQQLSKRLTNQDVIDMATVGLSDEVIIDKIHSTEGTDFDTSVGALKSLKAAKVSDAVIRAMINPHPAISAVDNARPSPPAVKDDGLPEEVGVYVELSGKLSEVEPEIVGWQTGGVVKSRVTLGLDKGHVNGKIMKSESSLQIPSPVVFVIKASEGTSVTEYQLLHLYKKDNRREFRAITGGVFHASGGAERNDLVFRPEKIANRTWRIRLGDLKVGEYGFLPPGVSSASIASNGKMYTFGILEGSRSEPSSVSSKKQDLSASAGEALAHQSQDVPNGSIGAFSDQEPTLRRDGILLSRVLPNGPADRAGIKIGDTILAIENHYLFTVEDLTNEIRRYGPGAKVTIRYRRYSSINETTLVLGAAE